REPVMLPMRIEPELVAMLERHGPLWVNTHFNHPNEITPEAAAAVDLLLRAGIPVNNQSVLLAGVNDSLEVMKALVQGLLRIRVRPYYLYHCDDVKGTAHLRTSIRRGLEILEGLRGHTTGFAVPTYVVDAPDGGGKIPLMPNYLVSQGERTLVLRNFEGVLVSVSDEPPTATAQAKGDGQIRRKRRSRAAQSVSDLLTEDSQRLVPAGLAHYERREALQSEAETVETAVAAAARPEPPPVPVPRPPRTRRAARDLRVIQGS
ncbi:MAG TPA: hypothetical protein VEG67_01450, partial [Myxococcota bacterium]|nr:hypothetical protein [Myxococcota bacterium]